MLGLMKSNSCASTKYTENYNKAIIYINGQYSGFRLTLELYREKLHDKNFYVLVSSKGPL